MTAPPPPPPLARSQPALQRVPALPPPASALPAPRDANARHAQLPIERRLETVVEALTLAAAGDFSRKLDVPEAGGDVVDRLTILVRFLVDDLERAEARRARELERVREIDRMKSRFINTAAHELGTPLTPMRLQLHMLRAGKAGPTSPGQDRALSILGRNLDRVLLLVADMLSISRMEAGELKLRKAPVDVAQLVRETCESFHDSAAARGLTVEAEAVGSEVVLADAARLGQVLDNLVTNALKFTPSGGRIVVRCRRRDSEAVVEVTDSGIGLTSDEITRLFQPFAKLADQSVHGDPGTGLGLYISKGLVERHGGLMWIDSQGKGKGTTVAFALPRAEPSASVPAAA